MFSAARARHLSTSASRPFKVLGLQQIAVGGPDKSKLAKLWTDVLGVKCVGTFQSEKENVDEDIVGALLEDLKESSVIVQARVDAPALLALVLAAARRSPLSM